MDLRRYLDRVFPARRLRAEKASLEARLERQQSRLRAERRKNARLRAQRDRARARADRLGERRRRDRDLRYVFIVTYGRSGSTLLQGILNSIPGYLIRGENGQVLRQLYEFDNRAREERQRRRRWLRGKDEHDHLPVTHPFHGIDRYPHGSVYRDLRRLFVDNVLGPAEDTRVVGFKEVRWIAPDTPEFVAWLRRLFPGLRLVVNTRNLDDVSRSGWWGEADDSRERLEQIDAMLRDLAVELGDDAFHVHYDDYVADPSTLADLFSWLGEDFDLERVRAVLDVPHSFVLPIRPENDEPGTEPGIEPETEPGTGEHPAPEPLP